MKNYRQALSALVLALVFSTSAFASAVISGTQNAPSNNVTAASPSVTMDTVTQLALLLESVLSLD
jgi:ABC-type arginine/histidine transport system permease subunit